MIEKNASLLINNTPRRLVSFSVIAYSGLIFDVEKKKRENLNFELQTTITWSASGQWCG